MLKKQNYLYGPVSDVLIPVNINFGDFFLRKLLERSDTVAFTNAVNGRSLTYGQIAQQAMNVAVSLSHLDVRKGDTVALCSENREEFWATLLGVVCTGAIFTPYNPGYANVEMKHIFEISKPKYIFCSPMAFEAHQYMIRTSNLKKIIVFGEKRYKNTLLYDDIAIAADKTVTAATDIVINNRLQRNVVFEEFQVADVDRNDVLFVLYSSGTTGLPKGVMLDHYNVVTVCCIDPLKMVRKYALTITPWFHALGLVGNLIGLSNGISFVTLPKFDVDLYLKTVETYKVNQLITVPPMLVAIAKSSATYDMSSVKKITCGAAPLSKDVMDLINKKFSNTPGVAQGYGLTECSIAISMDEYIDGKLKNPGSTGKVIPCTTVKIVDIKSREVLGAHKEGEICVKGAMVMKGYIGKDRRDDFDDEGFLKTGDIGYYDEEGYLYIVDRLKELIKYKGYQVAPAEIEAVLLEHEAVRDAGVVGIYDKSAGEVPVAFVVTQPGKTVTQKELQDFVAGKLSSPKRLRGGIRFIREIPKNPSGKILRKTLRVMANNNKSKL